MHLKFKYWYIYPQKFNQGLLSENIKYQHIRSFSNIPPSNIPPSNIPPSSIPPSNILPSNASFGNTRTIFHEPRPQYTAVYQKGSKQWQVETEQIEADEWQKVELSWDEEKGLKVLKNGAVVAQQTQATQVSTPINDHNLYLGWFLRLALFCCCFSEF